MKINSQVLPKFCAYMSLSLAVMILTAYVMALKGFDVLADMAGGNALGIWLILIAITAVTAFIIRKRIWNMKVSTLISTLITYSLAEGVMFSVFFLGDSMIGVVIVAMIFILAAMTYSEKALTRKGDANQSALAWALSVYLGVIMVVSFWVLIWGAWDTTKRRYTKGRR
ncbi:MAG: hypothetical protein IJQ08_10685 [Synergistaceae bacterium]|nr:hypothetical protein [Synergistaceae bacterium]